MPAAKHHIGVMPNLDLSDEEAAALTKELADITGNDRYRFSERIRTLKVILAALSPGPVRELLLPPPKVYASAKPQLAEDGAADTNLSPGSKPEPLDAACSIGAF